MKIDQLLHFYETARQQHIGKAASFFRISPSGISYSIECLERDLGVSLFEKRGKRIFLTEAGKRLMKKIPLVQQSIEELKNYVASDKQIFEGHYRIGATHLLAEFLLAPVIGDFFKKDNRLSFELFSLRSAEVVSRIIDKQLDLGFCFSPQRHPSLELTTLKQGQLKIYVQAKHPLLLSKKPLPQLSQYPASMPKAFGGIEICETHEVFRQFDLKPESRIAFDSYAVAIALIKNSFAWGFLPDWIESLPNFGLRALMLPTNWKAPYNISAVWSKERAIDGAMQQLVQQIQGN